VAENRKRLKQGKSAKDNVADLKEELNMVACLLYEFSMFKYFS
jgi:hypothetical protein